MRAGRYVTKLEPSGECGSTLEATVACLVSLEPTLAARRGVQTARLLVFPAVFASTRFSLLSFVSLALFILRRTSEAPSSNDALSVGA